MWFTFVTARLFHSLSIQPRLAATLLSSCSVANSPTRRVGLSPKLKPASLAQASFASVLNLQARPTLTRRTTELSDAGGPAHPHWQLTWPAHVRSSDLVSHLSCPSSPMGCPSFLWRVLCHRP